jgi:hypothetical protein
MGLKIEQSPMGRKIEPIRPVGPEDLCSKQIFRPVINAQLIKASSPILNFESPIKPEHEG